MSTSTSGANGTTIISGPNVIQETDFFVRAGILHPLVVGSIAVIVLFVYLRFGSNRSVAPITVFDWIINIALGSTLAGIVNGNSLTRGLLALATMLGFQYLTSHISSNYKQRFEWIFRAPPLIVVFRGEFLEKVMAKHRISRSDIYGALRQQGLLNVSVIEAIIIEANGAFSIFTKKSLDECDGEPAALMAVPAYKALSEEWESKQVKKMEFGSSDHVEVSKSRKNQVAMNHENPESTGWNVHSVLPV